METEIAQNELENTARYMFHLALEQNLQRPQLEYAKMIHSSPQLVCILKCEGPRGSRYLSRDYTDDIKLSSLSK